MTSKQIGELAHELWAAAQLLPGESIEDGVDKLVDILEKVPELASKPTSIPHLTFEIKTNPYGFCPICKQPGASRERRPDGYDTCICGHHYPSKDALPTPYKEL